LSNAEPDTKQDSYFNNTRTEIGPLLPNDLRDVLEVGAGTGQTLAYIKARSPKTRTVAIEKSTIAAAAARGRVDYVVEGDIEHLEIPFAPASFDAILLLDILEHLADPWAAVAKLTRLLRPRGSMIASIPNVRYYKVSLPLLLRGEWTLRDTGILDRTHLRFFVKETAIDLMTSTGLQLDCVVPTGVEKGRKKWLLNKLSGGLLQPFLAYQYLIRVSRAD
jgi:SAM-dependent methyltransferase